MVVGKKKNINITVEMPLSERQNQIILGQKK
jgi:hypothetical protein